MLHHGSISTIPQAWVVEPWQTGFPPLFTSGSFSHHSISVCMFALLLACKIPWCFAPETGSEKQVCHALQKWRVCWLSCVLSSFQMQLVFVFPAWISVIYSCLWNKLPPIPKGWWVFSRWESKLTLLPDYISPDFWSHFPSQRHEVPRNSLPRKRENRYWKREREREMGYPTAQLIFSCENIREQNSLGYSPTPHWGCF